MISMVDFSGEFTLLWFRLRPNCEVMFRAVEVAGKRKKMKWQGMKAVWTH